MLGPLGDLPLHPGGKSATLVARKLSDDETSLCKDFVHGMVGEVLGTKVFGVSS